MARPTVISLTSHRARFPGLAKCLKQLLNQSARPDLLILWLSEADAPFLPGEVLQLRQRGLDIRSCEDLGPYKKLVPARRSFPEAVIVTADDDILYPRHWARTLLAAHDRHPSDILCHRAHRIVLDQAGSICPYGEWGHDVQDAAARRASTDLLPTGVGGVLYPPGSLAPVADDARCFLDLCPTTDDLWFYWAGRLAGTRVRKVGPKLELRYVEGSQDVALWTRNRKTLNDRALKLLARKFGSPF